ncbi:MAG: Uma2 family endonuclease [Peptococcaceae bacterium]|jgi:Uma2 family endonuclease|nr:Uma2 family endonuclease [Peptococcaceae bacterium]
MVMMLLDETEMTLRDFIMSQYHHDGTWELMRGELVAMSPAVPNHEVVAIRLGRLFDDTLGKGPCRVYGGNMGLYFWEDDSFVMADLSVICGKDKFVRNRCVKGPELVVEILSPSTRKYCLNEKRDIYKVNGVVEYWVVDMYEGWVLAENFKTGMTEKFLMGDETRSDLFDGFHFKVDDILEGVLD